jgi:hypothetical protein
MSWVVKHQPRGHGQRVGFAGKPSTAWRRFGLQQIKDHGEAKMAAKPTFGIACRIEG